MFVFNYLARFQEFPPPPKLLAVTDVTALGDCWLAFDKKDEKSEPGFLVSATFVGAEHR